MNYVQILSKQSELRERYNAALDGNEPDAVIAQYRAQLSALEPRLREALSRDNGTPGRRPADGESRELDALASKASVRGIIDSVLNDRQTDGPERELQQHVGGETSTIPWRLLSDEGAEHRVDAVTSGPSDAASNQDGLIERVFSRAALRNVLNVRMPPVMVGAKSFPVISAGPSGSFAAADAAVDAEAGTINSNELKPKRLSAAYLIRQEDLQTVQGYEVGLRDDLRMALSDQLDKQLIGLGDAVQRGFLATSANGGIAARTAATTTVTYDLALEESALAVDGRYSGAFTESNWLMGDDTFRKLATLLNTGSGQTVIQYLRQVFGTVRASANIPAPSANVQPGDPL